MVLARSASTWARLPGSRFLSVRHRIHLIIMLALCVAATGVQWDFLQVLAWGRMMAVHAERMSLENAVTKTFDGEMCGLCRIVAKAKRAEHSRSNLPGSGPNEKLLLFAEKPRCIVIEAPGTTIPSLVAELIPDSERPEPPSPPPRSALA